MVDVHDKKTRSYNMSRIKGKDTKPEMLVRKFLFANGFRYRLYDKKLPGKPDIVLPKYKTAIFVNGCFWHGHKNCKKFVVPKTRSEFWLNKINTNILNDKKNIITLKNANWKVIIIWECQINKTNTFKDILNQIEK
ncbi:MAG: DNA mismatch endonuclease Vsr [Bacteroidales bacterium]|nr:DNA mismatch endonuclease Vsr [Bacteroidales bacterium]